VSEAHPGNLAVPALPSVARFLKCSNSNSTQGEIESPSAPPRKTSIGGHSRGAKGCEGLPGRASLPAGISPRGVPAGVVKWICGAVSRHCTALPPISPMSAPKPSLNIDIKAFIRAVVSTLLGADASR